MPDQVSPEDRLPPDEDRLPPDKDRLPPDEGEKARLALEKKRERYVWYYLAYFLFGIHIIAFVMIYAVLHAK